jgi:hypothetical protein
VGPGGKAGWVRGKSQGWVRGKAERASRRAGGGANGPILARGARAYFLLGKTPVPLVPP